MKQLERYCLLLLLLVLGACRQTTVNPASKPLPTAAFGTELRRLELPELGAVAEWYWPAGWSEPEHWGSDCCTGGSPAYGFAASGFAMVQERSGMCFMRPVDSLFQITFFPTERPYAAGWFDLLPAPWLESFVERSNHISREIYRQQIDWRLGTVLAFEERDFAVLRWRGTVNSPIVVTAPYRETLLLYTLFEDRPVVIQVEYAGASPDGRLDYLLSCLSTLRFVK